MKFRYILLLLALPAISFADVEMHFSDGTVGLISDGRVLIGTEQDSVLYRPGEEGIIVINRGERSWMRIKPGFAAEVQAQMKSQMDEMLASMPPEQRAMVEQQMQGMMPEFDEEMPAMNIARTGETDVVAGFDCDVAEISYGIGGTEEIVCIASTSELGISSADFEALAAAMQGMAELASLSPDSNPITDFTELRGVPIRTRGLNYGEESELISIDAAAIDQSRFEIPDGFSEVTLEQMMSR